MRRNKWITYGLPIMCFVFVLLFGAARVYAASAYGFEMDDLSAEEKQTIWQNINVHRISEFQNLTDFSVPIESFDVSEQGIILFKSFCGTLLCGVLGVVYEIIGPVKYKQLLSSFGISNGFECTWIWAVVMLILLLSTHFIKAELLSNSV